MNRPCSRFLGMPLVGVRVEGSDTHMIVSASTFVAQYA